MKRDMSYFITERGIELEMTRAQARDACPPGQDAADAVFALSRQPKIARQLEAIDAATLAADLKEYGAWDADQLADHDGNLQRLVWLAACDITERGSV